MSIIIASPDSLRAQVEAATGGKVTVLYDDKGFPSLMHVIPKFRYEDLGIDATFGTGVATAFIKGNTELPEIFIGQYHAQVHDGRAVSLPGRDPRASINYDSAKAACAAKGAGWHLMTMHEWAAIALWCHAQGFIPRGNTNYGRAHDATHEIGRRQDGGTAGEASGTARILTGSGPASWRHDNSMGGIADLVGNVWEWQHGMKLVDGQIHLLEDNSFDEDEANWTAMGHYISNEGGAPTLKNSSPVVEDAGISVSQWDNLAKDAGYTESQLLQRLLISPADVSMQGSFYVNTSGERFPIRGGGWGSGYAAGLGALDLRSARTDTISGLGFRPAFAL
ncbi:SUMF1/EgtB/PvdO family nonheme iron enzyme [Halomonas sp. PBN3]|uniref:SUMF1/EgtB/PvdO family nonheme iron enzyme n=1 Tax=Halomonas sp. PBN3 TaxID=1397528 RepID=UPI0003B87378|nr:SUMF1/EgtB/PvdO family nonheme iron enzyme [Halomonas sp. PBN3]ERS88848.1 hypothetical protein Q671_08045 [Halomonas sp. PBN3]